MTKIGDSNHLLKTTTIEYDKLGWVVRTESPVGDEVFREYDYLGRLIKVTDAIGDEEYEYDGTGQLTKVIDKAGKATICGYEARLEDRIEPLSLVKIPTWDLRHSCLRFCPDRAQGLGNLEAQKPGHTPPC